MKECLTTFASFVTFLRSSIVDSISVTGSVVLNNDGEINVDIIHVSLLVVGLFNSSISNCQASGRLVVSNLFVCAGLVVAYSSSSSISDVVA